MYCRHKYGEEHRNFIEVKTKRIIVLFIFLYYVFIFSQKEVQLS